MNNKGQIFIQNLICPTQNRTVSIINDHTHASRTIKPHKKHKETKEASSAWEKDNQAWWDWYVTLAAPSSAPKDSPTPAALAPIAQSVEVSTHKLINELSEPFALTEEQIQSFRVQGFIKIKHVLSPDILLHLRAELIRLLESTNHCHLDGGIRERFLSLDMVWLTNALVRQFVLSPRIGKLAADLLGAPSVRLYHDNVMSKEPGCGRTPWHNDDHHFPIASNDVVTVWIPLQPTPIEMGPLAFAHPLDTCGLVEGIPFNPADTSYDERVGQAFRRERVSIAEGAFDLGEISFHHNQNFHTAGPNHTERSRLVLSNTYFADGARLVQNPTMISGDWQKFAPGVQPGEKLATEVNPVCWPPAPC